MSGRENASDPQRRPEGIGTAHVQSGGLGDHGTAGDRQDGHGTPPLFDLVTTVTTHPDHGRRIVYAERSEQVEPNVEPVPGPRGPGPRRATTGPADAGAPNYWLRDAEAVVLATVRAGRTVTADDLHELYADEPSATGNAYGRLFASLAARGLLVEVGWSRSRRPEAHGRRVVQWATP